MQWFESKQFDWWIKLGLPTGPSEGQPSSAPDATVSPIAKMTTADEASLSNTSICVQEDPPLAPRDVPLRIYVLTMVACLVNFTVGFSMSIIAPALIFIEESLDASVGEISAIVSFALLGGLIGSVLSGWTSDFMGRRKTMGLGTAIMGMSGLACALSLGTSMSVVVAGIILTELAPTNIRGYVGSASQNFLAVGLIVSGFTGYLTHFFLKDNECWRPMFMVASVSGLVSFVLVSCFLEESPRWLVSRQRIGEAREVMVKIYGQHNIEFVQQELTSLASQHRHLAETTCFDLQDLTQPCHRKPLFLTCALKFIQQLTGTAVIVSYMVIIFTNTGATREDALLFTALSSLPQLITMVLGSWFLDLTGRKTLLLLSQLGIIATLIVMGIFQYFDGKLQTSMMILGVIMFRVFYSLGMGPIPLVLASEILPFKVRGRGLAISTLLHSLLGFILTASFPSIIRTIGEAPFYWALAIISMGGYIFITRSVDETSNIRLEDLEAMASEEPAYSPIVSTPKSDITFHVHGQR